MIISSVSIIKSSVIFHILLFTYDFMTIICNRLHDTVLDSDRSLTLSVWFTCDDIVDLFSRVCVWLYPGCMCCFLFLFSVSVFLSILYFVYDLIINKNKNVYLIFSAAFSLMLVIYTWAADAGHSDASLITFLLVFSTLLNIEFPAFSHNTMGTMLWCCVLLHFCNM